jgi:hypothetical protein
VGAQSALAFGPEHLTIRLGKVVAQATPMFDELLVAVVRCWPGHSSRTSHSSRTYCRRTRWTCKRWSYASCRSRQST